MNILKTLLASVVGIGSVLFAVPAKAELPPQDVIDNVYAGIQYVHGYEATPTLIWNIDDGYPSGCGSISGSGYCPLDHTVYITNAYILLAYEHGDAALAYMIAHEYAHAMQIAFGFQPGITPISELQADCLAGVYLGTVPNISFDEQDIWEIATFAYRIGDYEWGSEQHHGTPEQRVEAVVLGMQASLDGTGVAACAY